MLPERGINTFLNEDRLLYGPWQMLERDVARLMLANGFEDVRIVGGVGDKGGDVLGTSNGKLWVWQCKYTSTGPAPKTAIREVVDAGSYYHGDRLIVATSRPASDSMKTEKAMFERQGLSVEIADPQVLLRLMRRTPEYPHQKKKLRDYQLEATQLFRRALTDTGRAQLVMATGLGKTVVMADVVADLLQDGLVENDRVLILAHTVPLVEQLHSTFWYQLPKWVPTHQYTGTERPSFWDGITFATIQSVRSNIEDIPVCGLVLVDEAHHVGAETFRESIERLAPNMLGGVTATPWRGDGYDIDQILGPAVFQMGIAEGLRRGFLSEVDYRMYGDNIDWEFVQKASRHHYSLSQLNRNLILPTRDEEAAKIILQVFREEHRTGGIVYSPTILHANSFAAMLRHFGLHAECVSSNDAPRDRDALIARFKAEEMDILVTVDLFNEGVDVPDVDLLIFMRATHSRRIFVQQLGRGLRFSETKDKVIVLDFVSELSRMAEVLDLDRSARGSEVERLGLGNRLVQFENRSAGDFLTNWMLDQASLILNEGNPTLDLPRFDYPEPPEPGGVQ